MRQAYQFYRSAYRFKNLNPIIFATLLFVQPSQVAAVDFSEKDKQFHFGLSAAGTYLTFEGLRALGWKKKNALWAASFLSLTAGFIKELSDPIQDQADLEADALGTSVGVLFPLLIYEW
jgi:hypothetical protein